MKKSIGRKPGGGKSQERFYSVSGYKPFYTTQP